MALVEQKLREIPLDRLGAEQPGRRLLQRLEERMGVRAVDLDLGEHRESDVVGELAEAGDLLLVPRLLVAELVAGKTEHGEASLRATLDKAPRAPRTAGEAAFAGDIDDQKSLAVEIGERFGRPSMVVRAMSEGMGMEAPNEGLTSVHT